MSKHQLRVAIRKPAGSKKQVVRVEMRQRLPSKDFQQTQKWKKTNKNQTEQTLKTTFKKQPFEPKNYTKTISKTKPTNQKTTNISNALRKQTSPPLLNPRRFSSLSLRP